MNTHITTAVVVSQDPDNYALNVALQGQWGSQMPAVSVQVMTHGPRDAVRGSFPELPLPGQLGIVVFPRADDRNGVWIGAVSPALNDASTLAPGNGNTAFAAHFGGGVSVRTRDGTIYEQLPDGTILTIGSGVAPVLTRHTVGPDQQRKRSAFTPADRIAAPPAAPFAISITHPTGATATLSPTGNWSLTSAPGGTINGTAAHINLGDGGTLEALLKHSAATIFNGHTHPGGAGNAPSPQMAASSETSVLKAD